MLNHNRATRRRCFRVDGCESDIRERIRPGQTLWTGTENQLFVTTFAPIYARELGQNLRAHVTLAGKERKKMGKKKFAKREISEMLSEF